MFRITEWPLHYVVYIQKHAFSAFGRILKPHGLTNQSWRVLAALSDGVSRTIGQLAELTVFDRGNLGRTLDSMEKAGLVAREAAEDDRRAIVVRMTGKGRARFEAAHGDVLAVYGRLLDGLSNAERAALMSALRRLKLNCATLEGQPS